MELCCVATARLMDISYKDFVFVCLLFVVCCCCCFFFFAVVVVGLGVLLCVCGFFFLVLFVLLFVCLFVFDGGAFSADNLESGALTLKNLSPRSNFSRRAITRSVRNKQLEH